MLTTLGANSNATLAADMVWRATTYSPPFSSGSSRTRSGSGGWPRGLPKRPRRQGSSGRCSCRSDGRSAGARSCAGEWPSGIVLPQQQRKFASCRGAVLAVNPPPRQPPPCPAPRAQCIKRAVAVQQYGAGTDQAGVQGPAVGTQLLRPRRVSSKQHTAPLLLREREISRS